jgi:hypothetical protein
MVLTSLLSAPVKERLTLQQLAHEQNVAPATPWRWAMRGVHGLRLPTILIGHKRVTTRSAFVWWCGQLTRMADGQPAPAVDENDLKDTIERAEKEAARLGADYLDIGSPYWFAVVATSTVGILAAFPWLRWRFSLRMLFIVTTLITAVLGPLTYALKHFFVTHIY